MLKAIKEFFFGKPAVEAQPAAPYKVEAPVEQPASTPVKEAPAKAKRAKAPAKPKATATAPKARKPRATKAK